MEIAFTAASWLATGAVLVAWHLDQKRHDKQVQDILSRVSTEPRLEMRPAAAPPVVTPDVRRYIADHEADDEAWNEFRGDVPQEDDAWLS